jgi:hypothetical protein
MPRIVPFRATRAQAIHERFGRMAESQCPGSKPFPFGIFYAHLPLSMESLLARPAGVVISDLHTYNYRRDGRDALSANPQNEPEVSPGTNSTERRFWPKIVAL